MTIQTINTGSSPNSGNGDTLRSAFTKINSNFLYLYNTVTNIAQTTGTTGPTGPTGPAGPGSNNVNFGSQYHFAYYFNTGTTISATNVLNYIEPLNILRIGSTFNTTTNILHVKENYSNSLTSGVLLTQHHEVSDVNNFSFYRTRGTNLNQTPVLSGDDIADISFLTINNNNSLTGVVNLSVSIVNTSTNFPTGIIRFFINDGNFATPLEIANLTSDSTLKINYLDSLTTGTSLSIKNNLIPSQNLTYDLGSTSSQWRSLYVGTSTIYLGGTALSVSGGNLTVNGTPVVGGTGVTTPYDGVFVITNTTTNTTSDTGALVVAGGVGIGGNLHVQGYGHFGLEPNITYTNPLAVLTADTDDFTQIAIQNLSTGTSASSDFVATADDGTDQLYYIDMGINNSNYFDGNWTISGPHDGYLYVSNGNLTVGTTEPDTYVKIHIGGTLAGNVVATFREPGTDSTSSFSGALTIDGGIGITGQMHLQETLHVGNPDLALPNAVFIGQRYVDSYVQLGVQNSHPGTNASSDFIATADNGDDTSYYIDLGINSSGYNNLDWTVSGPNDGYLYINSGNLTLGTDSTGTNVKIHIGGTLAENVVATFDANSLTLAQHVLPAADLTYDLGSTSSQWRSLYVGTSTIYLGGTALSVSGGTITVDGNPISGGGGGASLGDRLTSSTYSVILEGTTGTVSVPNSIISQGSQLNLAGSQYSYDVGRYLRVRDGDFESHLHLDTPNNSSYDIILGDDNKFVRVDHTGPVVIGTNDETQRLWTFGTDGSLTLPGGNITIGNFFGNDAILCNTGTAFGILSQGAGSSVLQWLDDINAPTVVAGIAANSLYSNTGSVQIFTGAIGSPPQHTWTFSNDGNLTFPDSTTSTGSTIYVPYATSSSFKITTEEEMGPGTFVPLTFEVAGGTIILPSGNGNIQSGPNGGTWGLDSGNTKFTFPNLSRINYGDGGYLSTGTLQVDVRDGGTFEIKLNDSNKIWAFDNNGSLTFPDSTIQTTAYTGIASSGTTATSAAVGYIGMPQNKQNNTYSVQITDQGKHIYCTGTSFTVTIPANTVTNFPIGSTIAFIAGPNTTATIAIQTDTMYLGGSTGTSGSRTLAPFGMATAVKVEDTIWFISGAGLT